MAQLLKITEPASLRCETGLTNHMPSNKLVAPAS